MTGLAQENTTKIKAEHTRLGSLDSKLKVASKDQKTEEAEVDKLVDLVASKTSWLMVVDEVHNAMLDGMWLTSFKPVVEGGVATGVSISGEIFVDKAREIVGNGDATILEVFTARLIERPEFTDKTVIKEQPLPVTGDYTYKFRIYVALQKPIKVR
jgi:hypothetical protein